MAIRNGLEFGFRISIHKFSRLSTFKSERTPKLIDVFHIYLYTLFKQKFQLSVAGLNGGLYKIIRINN